MTTARQTIKRWAGVLAAASLLLATNASLASALAPPPGAVVGAETNTHIRIPGTVENRQRHSAVPVGDVNGDGLPDLAIAETGPPANTVKVHIVFGPWTPETIDLSNLGNRGFVINNFGTGFSVIPAPAGDVNGDGLDDIAVGYRQPGFMDDETHPFGRTQSGAVLIIFGKSDSTPVTPLPDANDPLSGDGYIIKGPWFENGFGGPVANIGDVSGDGRDDLAIGLSGTLAGATYVVFGKADTSAISIQNLGTHGYTLVPNQPRTQFGWAIANAGDFNGDGINDIVASAIGFTSSWRDGSVFVFPGGNYSGQVNEMLTIRGTINPPEHNAAQLGSNVAGVGDMNDDGLDDVLIRAGTATVLGRTEAGADYLILGRTTPGIATIGTPGAVAMQINYTNTNAASGGGEAIDAADVNNDGIPDLILGAPLADVPGKGQPGAIYVIYGSQTFSDVDLANMGTRGYTITGAVTEDFFGYTVKVDDLDLDSKPDIIAGVPLAEHGCLVNAGEVAIFLGADATPLAPAAGCAAANPTVTGTPDRQPNQHGWYNDDVTIDWQAVSAMGQGPASQPPDTIASLEGEQIYTSQPSCDPANHCATGELTLSIDKTDPTITTAAGGAPPNGGWYKTDTPVTFTCSDALSGIDSCPEAVTVTTEGANNQVGGTATDKAGNSATATTVIKLDKTAPTVGTPTMSGLISITIPILNISILNFFPPNVTSTNLSAPASDALSGVAAAEYYFDNGTHHPMTVSGATVTANASLTGLASGQHTLNIRVQDTAGNWSTVVSKTFTKF